MLIEDLSTITTIPTKTLEKLAKKAELCIADQLVEELLKDKSTIELDIIIGKLLLKLDDNTLKYKFIPSSDFERIIIQTIKDKHNPLANALEQSLIDKVTVVYKDFM